MEAFQKFVRDNLLKELKEFEEESLARRQHPPQLSSRMTVVTLRGRVVRDCYCTSFSCTCSLTAAQSVLSIRYQCPGRHQVLHSAAQSPDLFL
ncbi:hypothetical protein ADUPG1_011429 [Aduncisulcus paluster]|uniref:Uncharacterized protein n=1 Tax=Aduncisulcus paluster TaxID=2918883 RepID=A0ABQ5JVM3_9EUKA|nr:hypothetical protein ADUPG1_011429 [Aduncisulcus paluster]